MHPRTNTPPGGGLTVGQRRHGGHSGGETPGHIPNPEAKPSSADGTAPARVWESRTPPDKTSVEGRPEPGRPSTFACMNVGNDGPVNTPGPNEGRRDRDRDNGRAGERRGGPGGHGDRTPRREPPRGGDRRPYRPGGGDGRGFRDDTRGGYRRDDRSGGSDRGGADRGDAPRGRYGAGRRDEPRQDDPRRGDRPRRFEQGDRPRRFEQGDRPRRFEQGDRPRRFEQGDRPRRFEQGDRPRRSDDRPRRIDDTDRPRRFGQDDRPRRFGDQDKPRRSEQGDRSVPGERPRRFEQGDRPRRFEPGDRPRRFEERSVPGGARTGRSERPRGPQHQDRHGRPGGDRPWRDRGDDARPGARRSPGYRPGDRPGDRPDGDRPWREREAQREDRDTGPEVPEDIKAEELDGEVRAELRSLARPTAERVARHLVAAGRVVDEDPALALAHATAARRLAPRVAAVREAAGIAAYQAGDWPAAIAELRAYHRMTGRQTYLAALADCERALGRPAKAIDIFRSADRAQLDPAETIELLVVAAGARRDLGQEEAAVAMLQVRELGQDAPWSARLRYAYADALLGIGRAEEAREWFARAVEADDEGTTDAAERLLELDGVQLDDDEDQGDEDQGDEDQGDEDQGGEDEGGEDEGGEDEGGEDEGGEDEGGEDEGGEDEGVEEPE